jgi:hypothetical protein
LLIAVFLCGLSLRTNAQQASKVKPDPATDSLKTAQLLTHADSLALHRRDSIRRAIVVDVLVTRARLMSTDSLKLLIKHTTVDTFKAPLYTELASRYLNYDTIVNTGQRQAYQKEGLNYSLVALHLYSAYNDSTGLRTSFDGMAKVYLSQKKYSQAKWFILQSNTISRARNDIPNIIASLLTLVEIQSGIKEYKLARADLDEALQLSVKNRYQKTELDIFKKYALIYSRMKDYTKEAVMQKKYDSLSKKIQRDETAALAAKLNSENPLKNKKQDPLQSKKKSTLRKYQEACKKLIYNNETVIIFAVVIVLLISILLYARGKR